MAPGARTLGSLPFISHKPSKLLAEDLIARGNRKVGEQKGPPAQGSRGTLQLEGLGSTQGKESSPPPQQA